MLTSICASGQRSVQNWSWSCTRSLKTRLLFRYPLLNPTPLEPPSLSFSLKMGVERESIEKEMSRKSASFHQQFWVFNTTHEHDISAIVRYPWKGNFEDICDFTKLVLYFSLWTNLLEEVAGPSLHSRSSLVPTGRARVAELSAGQLRQFPYGPRLLIIPHLGTAQV